MIQKHKRFISLFVALSFLALLQISAMPLHADRAPDQGGAAISSPEQGPSYIEEEGASSPKGKKSIVPVILIGLGVAAVAAVLVLVVLKTKYDIVGKWTVNYDWKNSADGSTTMEFIGDKKSGDVHMLNTKFGTYTVDGKDVSWNISFIVTANYVGKFTDKTHMSGTMTNTSGNSGTWTAVKQATATGIVGDARAVVGLPAGVEK